MADEVNRYEQITDALKTTYIELVESDAKMVSEMRGYISPDATSYARDAQAVRVAMASPGLIAGLAKHLFGEVDG